MKSSHTASSRAPRLRQACAALALGMLASAVMAQGGNFGSATPSVSDIVNNLRGEGDSLDGVRTRALRPGAASQATSAPTAPVPQSSQRPGPLPPVAQPARAPAISMQIQFEFGSDRIGRESQQTMDNLARALASSELQGRRFVIVGHTDGVGSAEYNQRLSQRRAASVKAYLVQNGVDATRLKTEGKGFAELLNPGNPRASENRRVEIISAG